MKYIRTEDGKIFEKEYFSYESFLQTHYYHGRFVDCKEPIKEADTIEELCDCYSYDIETTKDFLVARSWKLHNKEREIFGCVKTDKGLIYVAKMNDKGELELL